MFSSGLFATFAARFEEYVLKKLKSLSLKKLKIKKINSKLE